MHSVYPAINVVVVAVVVAAVFCCLVDMSEHDPSCRDGPRRMNRNLNPRNGHEPTQVKANDKRQFPSETGSWLDQAFGPSSRMPAEFKTRLEAMEAFRAWLGMAKCAGAEQASHTLAHGTEPVTACSRSSQKPRAARSSVIDVLGSIKSSEL